MSKRPWARVYPHIPAESDKYGIKRLLGQMYYEAMVSDYLDHIKARKRKALKKKRKKHGKGA